MTRSPWKELSNMELKATKQRNKGVAMEISCDTGDTTKPKHRGSLQEAFKKFRKNRLREIRLSKQVDENILKSRADPVVMDQLRTKFVERCKHYFGIPYAKKYQQPETQEFHSPLFLDCCGLIRKVLRDLRKDFGFEIGPWNQAYMFDTLPKDIQSTEDMKPGDLVFVSGVYYNKNSKKQCHNMVHVEVWAGDGEKTIGARWQKGKVQYHDSYKFAAKSYHSMEYHFKSIDTWLMGICKSHCKEHSWEKSTYRPGKNSIFTTDQPSEMEDQGAEPEDQTDNQQTDNVAGQKSVGIVDHMSLRKVNQVILNCQTYASEECEMESMIRGSEVFSDYYQTNEKPKDNYSGFTETRMNPEILQSRAFYDLEECVHWLVSSVTSCIANGEATEAVDDPTVESPEKLPAKSNSFCSTSKEGIVASDNLVDEKPQSRSCFPEIDGILCVCPQCCHIEMHCIHQEPAVNESNSKDEAKVEITQELNSSKLSSSLECFDFTFAGEGEKHLDTVADGVIHCPSRPNKNGQHKSTRSVSPSKTARNGKAGDGSFRSSGDSGGDNGKNNEKDSSFKNTRDGAKSVDRLSTRQPCFYIGGGNGNWMIEATLTSLGWRKIEDKMDESFKLKWVECKSQINYDSFREGEQIVNHISNMNLLTTKLGLLCSLQEYERVKEKVGKVGSKFGLPLNEFVPETHKLMGRSETLKFADDVYKDGETWICKPIGMNQGKGIYLVNSREQLIEKLNIHGTEDTGVRRSRLRPPQGRIIQRYVMNPLLLNGYKFDIRAYMLIASTTPYVVLYHPGYVRLSCVPYTPYTKGEAGLHAHLTNQYVQKKHPMYSSMKEETVWSFDRLQTYIDEQYAKNKGLPENWVFSTFTKRMQQIMITCFHSVRQKLHRRTGTFDLLGFDFLIDEDFKVWLLEVNINPALHTNCQVLMNLLPGVVDETLKIVIEICDKTKKKLPVFPLDNLNGFQVLFNGERK